MHGVRCMYKRLRRTWWLHQMETFFALLILCEGNPPVTGGFPSQRPVTRNFAVFFDLRLNKCLSKQSRRRWFETPSRSLWRHCNDQGRESCTSPVVYMLCRRMELVLEISEQFGKNVYHILFENQIQYQNNISLVQDLAIHIWSRVVKPHIIQGRPQHQVKSHQLRNPVIKFHLRRVSHVQDKLYKQCNINHTAFVHRIENARHWCQSNFANGN